MSNARPRIADLEREPRLKDKRISELKDEIEEIRELLRRMEQHAQEHDEHDELLEYLEHFPILVVDAR